MFLNYGAGLHGHEFSGPKKSLNDNFIQRKSPLISSSLVSSSPLSRRNTINGRSTTSHSQIQNLPLERLPRDVETIIHFQEATPDFDSDMTSDGEAGSLLNLDSEKYQSKKNLRRRKRDPQKSSVFHLAHPAPTLSHTQKFLKILPKIILQLQLLSDKTRPRPYIDVLPSHVLIPRLATKFTRLLRGKGELGSNDVIIVRSENYDDNIGHVIENNYMSEDCYSNRNLIAVICQMPRAKGVSQGVAEIVFSDGSICIATPLPGGLYEIRIKDEGGKEIVARWWIKKYPKRQSIKFQEFADVNADLKYAFSIIDPDCKRHPTLATITHNQLEILDSYTTLSSSSGRYPPTITIPDGLKDQAHVQEVALPERTTRKIDSKMQTLIQVTGIWVSLRQNWCPCFKYNDALAVACTSTHVQPVGRVRPSSLTMMNGYPKPVGDSSNTPESLQNYKRVTNLESAIRRVSIKGRLAKSHLPHNENPVKLERTMSAGSAFVQRITARRSSICESSTTSRKDDYTKTKRLSHDISLERQSTDTSSRSFTPPNGLMNSPLIATPKRTSKEHRRTQSAFYPSSTLHTDSADTYLVIHSNEIGRESDYPFNFKPRASRWKLISNFFRRLGGVSSHQEPNSQNFGVH